MKTMVEISARHIHLKAEDFRKLFEKDEPTVRNKLSLDYEYAANETVEVVGPEGRFVDVRVVGPLREKSQFELSMSNARVLGIDPPIKISGESGGAKVKIVGPKGEIFEDIAIIPKRHWHLATGLASKLKVRTGQNVAVKIKSRRSVIYYDVITRVDDDFKNHVHLDTDEGNAAGIEKNTTAEIII
jgi:putative phosphotransacetylase